MHNDKIIVVLWLCLALALLAALGYILMGAGVLHAADLTQEDAPPGFEWIAGCFYVIGGLLLLMQKRGMFIALAVINIFPIAVFYMMWSDRTDVMSSAPGLLTKIPQVLLEAGLIYLAIKFKPGKNADTAK